MSANPLTSTLAALIESAASAALALNADAVNEISSLGGQTLLLELSTLPNLPTLGLRISCSDEGRLAVMADSEHNTTPPNAIVRGAAADVVQALWSDTLPAGVSIEGDERLLMALKRCFQGLTPDWRERAETLVAQFSGDRPILQDVLGTAELALDTLRNTFSTAFNNTRQQADSATDRFWAKEDDIEAFATRLEDLQLAVDRLNARVSHLTERES